MEEKEDIMAKTLGLSQAEEVSEDDLFVAIRARVETLLDESPNLLFSYLYRLDILEHDIKHALSKLNPDNPIDTLAQLILKKQKQRIAFKKKYKQDPIKGMEY